MVCIAASANYTYLYKKKKKMTKNTDFILEKAFSEFLNSSYAEVSTNDLERATGLTRGAIYYTYKSKEELFRAVIERFVLDKQHVLRKTGFHEDAAKWISLKEYLEIYISGARNTIESMRRFVKEGNNGFGGYFSLLYQARRLFPDFDNEIHELFFREISFITAVARNAVENGEIKELDPEEVARNLRYIFIGHSFEESFNGGMEPDDAWKHLMFYYQLIKK